MLPRTINQIWIFMALVATAAFAGEIAAPPPENEREAMVRVVTEWDLDCSGSKRSGWKNMTAAWYNEITNGAAAPTGHGGESWYADGFYHQEYLTFEGNLIKVNYIVDSDFTDKNVVAWGKDHQHDKLDEVDAAMVATHGGSSGIDGSWEGSMRINEIGGGNCDAYQGDMELGADLEFLHLSSCVSMDEGDWHPDWSSSFQGVHQIDGFHGIMYIYSNQDWYDRYKDFADDSFDIPIALAWLDNHYRYTCSIESQDPITLARKDQCPVARAAGFGQADTIDRLFTERYDNILSDPVNPTWHHVLYLGGCDPASGDPLGDIETECDPFAKAGGAIWPKNGPAKATLGDYTAQVETALPAYDASVLDATDGPDWMSGLTIATVARAVNDTFPSSQITDGVRTEAVDPTNTRVYKLDSTRDRVRFANLDRQFEWTTSPRTAWDATASLNLALGAFTALSLPSTEIDPTTCCRAETVLGTSFDDTDRSGTPFGTYESERMVTIGRTINALPVMESLLRATVSNSGEIARLLVRWPQFVMPEGLVLRPRQNVVDEIAGHIADVQSGAPVSLYIYLAYARAGSSYLPVAAAEFDDGVSAEIFIAPLVGVSKDSDFDGIPDTKDGCPDDPDPDQADGDRDGIGDACDNCPGTANADQRDADGDGTGDACAVPDGACVFRDGSCDDVTSEQCLAEDGSWQGPGSRCTGVESLTLSLEASRISWTPGPIASSYDLVRGGLSTLRGESGDFVSATEECVADNHPTTETSYAADPSSGDAFFFLVRQVTAAGNGSYDADSASQNNSRDPGVAASGFDCP